MSTSCVYFKEKEFWENDIVICLALYLLINSKQEKSNWIIKYFKTVLNNILESIPVGTTDLNLDVYFIKYYKRKKFIEYIKNTIKEFELDNGGDFNHIEINNMLKLSEIDQYKENSSIKRVVVFLFLNKLIDLLDCKE